MTRQHTTAWITALLASGLLLAGCGGGGSDPGPQGGSDWSDPLRGLDVQGTQRVGFVSLRQELAEQGSVSGGVITGNAYFVDVARLDDAVVESILRGNDTLDHCVARYDAGPAAGLPQLLILDTLDAGEAVRLSSDSGALLTLQRWLEDGVLSYGGADADAMAVEGQPVSGWNAQFPGEVFPDMGLIEFASAQWLEDFRPAAGSTFTTGTDTTFRWTVDATTHTALRVVLESEQPPYFHSCLLADDGVFELPADLYPEGTRLTVNLVERVSRAYHSDGDTVVLSYRAVQAPGAW